MRPAHQVARRTPVRPIPWYGEGVKEVELAALLRDPAARFAFLADLVGFGADDWAALADSVTTLSPRLPGILDAVYAHLLAFDDTRRIFLGSTGEIDPVYMALRKEHLTDWVLRTVGAAGDPGAFARYLLETGRRHTGVAGDPGRVVPPRYMVALTSFLQTALMSTLLEALADQPEQLRRQALAWNKMMMLQLELFLKAMHADWDSR